MTEGVVRPVPMGALEVASPPDALEIRGLGSCVAVALFDTRTRVAGLAHAVVPRPLKRRGLPGPAWATTEAVPRLIEAMEAEGALRRHVVARLAGGSALFASTLKGFNVGAENARVAAGALADLGIPVLSRDLGGHVGRNVRFDPLTGELSVTRRAVDARKRPRAPTPALEEDAEIAGIVLQRAIAPLATMLVTTVDVEGPAAHVLSARGLREFFGGVGARLYWSVTSLGGPEHDAFIGVVMPEAHAVALAARLRDESDDDVSDDDVLAEITNLVTAHAATSIAGVVGKRLVPGVPVPARGSVATFVAGVARAAGQGSRVLALHGRIHAEGVLRGVDVAILLPEAVAPQGPWLPTA